MRALLRKARLD